MGRSPEAVARALDPEAYARTLSAGLRGASVTAASGARISLPEGLRRALAIVRKSGTRGTIWFVGNGGSASHCSHMSVDFWKNGGLRAAAFNDTSLLTCLGNDYGYRHVFERSLRTFARPGDALIAISSSGRSENILRAAAEARRRGVGVLTFTGFRPDNPLRRKGDLNFYVDSGDYGPVEIVHLALIHCILDAHIATR